MNNDWDTNPLTVTTIVPDSTIVRTIKVSLI